MFRRKRPTLDMMLLQRHQMFIRHPDGRLFIISVKRGRTFINLWDVRNETIVGIGRVDVGMGFDGYGWDLAALIAALDTYMGRVCGFCGRAISHNRLYCSDGCRQGAYRARKG